MSLKDDKIISRLLNFAKDSELNQKLAAAIYCGNKLITIHRNSHRNKFGKEIRSSGHSEIACLYEIYPELFDNINSKSIKIKSRTKFKPSNLTMYVARYLKTGDNNYGFSAPCWHCMLKIKKSGIKKLVYINESGNIEKLKTKDYNTSFITSGYRTYKRNNICPN
jgi:hypothetical protein